MRTDRGLRRFFAPRIRRINANDFSKGIFAPIRVIRGPDFLSLIREIRVIRVCPEILKLRLRRSCPEKSVVVCFPAK
jgi:hypothetical protein